MSKKSEQLVSFGPFLRHYSAKATAIAFGNLLTLVGGLGFASTMFWFAIALYGIVLSMASGFDVTLLSITGMMLSVIGAGALCLYVANSGRIVIEEAKRRKPVALLTPQAIRQLSLPEMLLRGSREPASVPASVLLRPAAETSLPPEELLRPAQK